MYRCAIFFNSNINIEGLNYFNLNEFDILVKLYKFNNDYYMIIEGEEYIIEDVIKLIENNKTIDLFEIISYHPIENKLLNFSIYQKLDINNKDDYLYIKMMYDVKDNMHNTSLLKA